MYLAIRQDGLFVEITDDSGTHWEPIEKFELPIAYYLNYYVEFSKDLKFKDILYHLNKYREEFIVLYMGYLKHGDFKDIFEPERKGDDEIGQTIDDVTFIWETVVGRELNAKLPEIDVWSSCMGVKKVQDPGFTSIEFTEFLVEDIYHLLDKKVFLDSYIEFKDSVKKKPVTVLSGFKQWTLNDIILGIIRLTMPIVEEDPEKETEVEFIEEDDDEIDTISATQLLDVLDKMEG